MVEGRSASSQGLLSLCQDPVFKVGSVKTLIQKDTCTPKFIAELFTIAKTQKQPKCPSTDEWIKKMSYIQYNIYNGILLLSHKKE